MTNVLNVPLQNAFEVMLENSISATAVSMTLSDAPDFTLPVGQGVYAVIDPKNSYREVVLITAIVGAVCTITRGQADYQGGASTAQTHSGGAKVVITNSFQIYKEYADAINSKLDSTGGNPSTTFDLDLTGSNFRIRKDGANMKFTDDSQAEVSLSTLAAAAGTDEKSKVSAADTTSSYLDTKITVSGTGITKSIVNPGANETLNLAVSANNVVDSPYVAAEEIAVAGVLLSKTTTTNTVEHTQNNTFATSTGAESTFNADGTACLRSCYVSANKVAKFYRDTTDSLGKIVIGTVDPRTGLPTWGTAVSLGFDVGSTAMKRMADGKLVIGYRNVSDNLAYAQIVMVTGTVPALGAAKVTVFGQNASSQNTVAVECIDTDKIVIAVRDTADSNKGHMACATVTADAIGTWGSTAEWLQTGTGHATSGIAIGKSDTDKCIVFCRDGVDTKGYGSLVVASGTTLTPATEVEIDSNATSAFAAEYITAGKTLVTWLGGASVYTQARVASVSGLTLTYPTVALAVNAAASLAPSVSIMSTTVAHIAYEESGASDGKFNEIAISGTTLVASAQYSINGSTNNVSEVCVSKVNGNDRIMVSYVDEADTNKGNAEVYQSWDNTSRIVGFATATAASGAAVNVRSKGISPIIAGIVAGTQYYSDTKGGVNVTNTGKKIGLGANTNYLDIDIDILDPEVFNFFSTTDITGAQAETLTASASSDADSLHTHTAITTLGDKLVGVGIPSATKHLTFVSPFMEDTSATSNAWTNTGGAEIVSHLNFATFAVTSGHTLYLADGVMPGLAANGNVLSFADSYTTLIAETWVNYDSVVLANGDSVFGFVSNVAALLDYNDAAYIDATFGVDSSGKLYAHTANAGGTTNHTETEITGVTLTALNNYRIVINKGVNVQFYVNGVLKATHTTNLPAAGADILFGYGVYEGGAGTAESFATAPTFSLDF